MNHYRKQLISLASVCAILLVGLAAAVPPAAAGPLFQATDTPTPTPSPTATLTPTPSADVVITLEPDGQTMVVRYEITAGDLLNATLTFATLLAVIIAAALLLSGRC
jgi:hypothetical protein